MKDATEEIYGVLMRAHSGEPWHGPSRAIVLAGITAAQAAWRPAPDAHNIWEIVLHMCSWTHEVAQRAKGRVPGEPADGDWPAMPKPTAADWKKTLRELDAEHALLIEAVRALPEGRLDQRVGTGDDPSGRGITVRAMLCSLADHDNYHTGQVAMLKRLAKNA
jgi:uncharacterized damage-inducible protein DinB